MFGEHFLQFSKNDVLLFHHIFFFFRSMFLLRGIKAYLCPNMINFDGVNFSEGRAEEVISFF